MRKLIEKQHDSLIVCDNPKCDYEIIYTDAIAKSLVYFIDMPCPNCGENLLTKQDYIQYQNMIRVVNFINKWFSWITIFYSKKILSKATSVSVHVHNGINISNNSSITE